MAHILFLAQVLPYPLNSGAKIRQYHMLRHLAQHHEVTLVPFTRADGPPEDPQILAETLRVARRMCPTWYARAERTLPDMSTSAGSKKLPSRRCAPG